MPKTNDKKFKAVNNMQQQRTLTGLFITFVFIFSGAVICFAGEEQQEGKTANDDKPTTVEAVLEKLNKRTVNLKSYQAKIEYTVRQPLFESKTVRTGMLYYAKYDKASRLRVNFKNLTQDNQPPQEYREYFILEGKWLTQIDYQIEQVKRYELADVNEPNQPVDVFELVSRNFPIIGFSNVEELKEQFSITLVDPNEKSSGRYIQLHLKVKPDSIYADDYTSLDFWIDTDLFLPARISAVAIPEDEYQTSDIYITRLIDPAINKPVDKKVFDYKIPKGFGTEVVPLKNNKPTS